MGHRATSPFFQYALSFLSRHSRCGSSGGRRCLFRRCRDGVPGTAQPGRCFDFGIDWRVGRRPIFLLPRAGTCKAMVGSLLEDRVPEKDNSVAHAQACHEVHPCVAFFAGIENRDSHRVCVRGYFANPIFQSELDQCNSVGERHHVCHHNARADFPRSARLEGMVGSDRSRGSYRGLLSVVGACRPGRRTAWRMTWMMRSRMAEDVPPIIVAENASAVRIYRGRSPDRSLTIPNNLRQMNGASFKSQLPPPPECRFD